MQSAARYVGRRVRVSPSSVSHFPFLSFTLLFPERSHRSASSPPPPLLRHPERRPRKVVAHSRGDEHGQVATMELASLASIVERHRDAGGPGVAPPFHDRVGLLHRQSEVVHHELDRRLALSL